MDRVTGEPIEVKVENLNPQSKSVNLTVKVISLGKPQAVPTRGGGDRHVSEALVGDSTGTVIMSLWENQREGVEEGSVLRIENGYISLVKGHMRLNVGRYGRMTRSSNDVGEVNETLNLSEVDHSSGRGGDLGDAVDLRFRKGPWASTGYGMEDEARRKGIKRKRRDRYDRYL